MSTLNNAINAGFKTGTFTPTITGSSANPTSITYSTQVGEYVQLGNIIFYQARVVVSALTIGAASGNLQITGLPVASHDNGAGYPGSAWIQSTAFSGGLASNIGTNTTVVNIIEYASSSLITILPITALTSSSDFSVSGFYFTS